MADKYTNINVSKKETEVEITGEIPAGALASHRAKAIREISNTANIPGFRKGHVPEKIIVEKFGDIAILSEAAELAIKEIAPEIIEKNVTNFVGQPQISITKLAPGNPVGFSIKLEIIPDFKLPDYAKIAKKEMAEKDENLEVAEKDIEDVIKEIQKQHAHIAYHKHLDSQKDPEDKDHAHSHDHSPEELKKHEPEINDEFVKTLGNFENVADFKAKIKDNLAKEKQHRAIEKKRGALLEKLVAETELAVPNALIEQEIGRMFAQFESDVAGMGVKVEDYLKHIKKTPEDIRKDWLPDATKRAKLNIILEKIAEKETIKPDAEAVNQEIEFLKKRYPDADPLLVSYSVNKMLTIEKVIQFLENQK